MIRAIRVHPRLHFEAAKAAHENGWSQSGPKYDSMVEAAAKCLRYYNEHAPKADRKSVRDLK